MLLPCSCSAAEEAFSKDQSGGSGLDVIFLKLGNMETKITDEQTTEGKRMAAFNSKCAKELKTQSDIIAMSSKTRQELKGLTAKSNTLVRSKLVESFLAVPSIS